MSNDVSFQWLIALVTPRLPNASIVNIANNPATKYKQNAYTNDNTPLIGELHALADNPPDQWYFTTTYKQNLL
jgi:hypothetical protein